MKWVALILLVILLLPSKAEAGSGDRGCGGFSGRAYVVCKESGLENMPEGLAPGTPHAGPSTATGPCGMLRATREAYGGDGIGACTRYMQDRYGSWARAERFHRRRGFW